MDFIVQCSSYYFPGACQGGFQETPFCITLTLLFKQLDITKLLQSYSIEKIYNLQAFINKTIS